MPLEPGPFIQISNGIYSNCRAVILFLRHAWLVEIQSLKMYLKGACHAYLTSFTR